MGYSSFVSRMRADCVIGGFEHGVFLTLTTADIVDYPTIRARWRAFRHDYTRFIGHSCGWIMCYEPHPHGHGWHIHVVFNSDFLDVNVIRKYSSRHGFGRIHIERVDSVGMSGYISKYISKSAKRARDLGCERIRLINCSRGVTRLRDIVVSSRWSDYIRVCMANPIVPRVGHWGLANYRLASAYGLGLWRGFDGCDVGFVPSEWIDARKKFLPPPIDIVSII